MIKFDVEIGLRLQKSVHFSFFKFVKNCGQKYIYIETSDAIV